MLSFVYSWPAFTPRRMPHILPSGLWQLRKDISVCLYQGPIVDRQVSLLGGRQICYLL